MFSFFFELKTLLETHDRIAGQRYQPQVHSDQCSENGSADRTSINGSHPYDQSFTEWEMPADISAVRVVGLRKNPGEPLVNM